jgi:hypothetical protein
VLQFKALGSFTQEITMCQAACDGNLPALQLALERGDTDTTAAINAACTHGHLHVLQFLVERRSGNNLDIASALMAAIEHKQLKILEYLVALPLGSLDFARNFAFIHAARYGNVEAVHFLRAEAVRRKTLPSLAVLYSHSFNAAASSAHFDMMHYLLPFLQPDMKYDRLLEEAIDTRHHNVVKFLLELPRECNVHLPQTALSYMLSPIVHVLVATDPRCPFLSVKDRLAWATTCLDNTPLPPLVKLQRMETLRCIQFRRRMHAVAAWAAAQEQDTDDVNQSY